MGGQQAQEPKVSKLEDVGVNQFCMSNAKLYYLLLDSST